MILSVRTLSATRRAPLTPVFRHLLLDIFKGAFLAKASAVFFETVDEMLDLLVEFVKSAFDLLSCAD